MSVSWRCVETNPRFGSWLGQLSSWPLGDGPQRPLRWIATGTLFGLAVARALAPDKMIQRSHSAAPTNDVRGPPQDCAGSLGSPWERHFAEALRRGFVEWDAPSRLELPLRAWFFIPNAHSADPVRPKEHSRDPVQSSPHRFNWLILIESDRAAWTAFGRIPPKDPHTAIALPRLRNAAGFAPRKLPSATRHMSPNASAA